MNSSKQKYVKEPDYMEKHQSDKNNMTTSELQKKQMDDMRKMASDSIYVLEAFSRHVREDPNRLMLVNPATKTRVSRARVDEISARVYAYLKHKGIGRESRVMICLPRGEFPFLAMLGVLKAGAAFTLVEDNYAAERIDFIRENFKTELFLDMKAWGEAIKEKPLSGYEKANPSDLALAVYTSGTTGQPKGVLHEYGNISLSYISSGQMRANIGDDPHSMAMLVPLNFVAAINFMLYVLFWGDTIHFLPYTIVKNTEKLTEYILDNRIEYTFMTPSLFKILPKKVGQVMKLILIGGEPANGIYDEKIKLYNGYAMSESMFMVLGKNLDREYDHCPSGNPPFPLAVHLLDEDGKDISGSEAGEICFPDPYFRGYADLPEKTKEALAGGYFHSRDIGKRSENGEYFIEGRADDMIKINGNRVEPAEIETVAKKILGIEWCGARGFVKKNRSFLCLYYTADIQIDQDDLREKMGQYLPYYMIPAYFIHISEIPMNSNGKFVRKLLPEPDITLSTEDYVAPATDTQKRVCELFEKILHVEKAGIHDDFFDLGGDSLSAMALATALGSGGPDAMEIFRQRTPEKIARFCDENRDILSEDPEVREMAARKNLYPLTAFQLNMFDYQLYHPMTSMWNLTTLFSFDRDKIDAECFADALNRAIDHHTIFRTVLSFDADGRIVQSIDEDIRQPIEMISVSEEEFAQIKDGLNHPFHLIGQSLMRAGLYLTPGKLYFLLSGHHIVIDGMGINAILNTIASFYEKETDLPIDIFYSWLDEQEQIKDKPVYQAARQYLQETYGKESWCDNLTEDHSIDELSKDQENSCEGVVYNVQVPENVEKRLQQEYHLTTNGLCAAVLLLSLHETEKKDNVMINWVYSNRNSKAEEASGGMMLKLIPLGMTIKEDTTEEDVFKEVAIRIPAGIENCCCDWWKTDDQVYQDDAMFVVYESSVLDMQGMQKLGASIDIILDPDAPMIRRSNVQVINTGDGLRVEFYYMGGIFDDDHLNAFHAGVVRNLEKLGCTVTKIMEE